jgi:hypothetical protein
MGFGRDWVRLCMGIAALAYFPTFLLVLRIAYMASSKLLW